MEGDMIADTLWGEVESDVSEDDVDVLDQKWIDKYDSKAELEAVAEFDKIVQVFKREGIAMEDFSNFNEKFHVHVNGPAEYVIILNRSVSKFNLRCTKILFGTFKFVRIHS